MPLVTIYVSTSELREMLIEDSGFYKKQMSLLVNHNFEISKEDVEKELKRYDEVMEINPKYPYPCISRSENTTLPIVKIEPDEPRKIDNLHPWQK